MPLAFAKMSDADAWLCILNSSNAGAASSRAASNRREAARFCASAAEAAEETAEPAAKERSMPLLPDTCAWSFSCACAA